MDGQRWNFFWKLRELWQRSRLKIAQIEYFSTFRSQEQRWMCSSTFVHKWKLSGFVFARGSAQNRITVILIKLWNKSKPNLRRKQFNASVMCGELAEKYETHFECITNSPRRPTKWFPREVSEDERSRHWNNAGRNVCRFIWMQAHMQMLLIQRDKEPHNHDSTLMQFRFQCFERRAEKWVKVAQTHFCIRRIWNRSTNEVSNDLVLDESRCI